MMKNPFELSQQLSMSEQVMDRKIAPNHLISREEVLAMPVEDLKKRYPKRYEIYLKLLRQQISVGAGELIEEKRWLDILNNLDDYIVKYESEINDDPRTPIQHDVFRSLRDFLEQGNTSGYVKLPTGTGKTRIFRRFLEAVHQRSVVVVPSNIIVGQTVKEFGGTLLSEDVGVVNQDSKDFAAGTIIVTYASLIRNVKNGEIPPKDFSCLILDEAHKALGAEVVKVVDQFKHAIRIGFTATPEYTEKKNLSTLLNDEIYRMDVAEAIRAGALCNARTLAVKTNVDLSSIGISKGDYDEKELAKKINIQARNQLAVDYYKKNFNGQRGVAYCVEVDHAITVAKLFNEAGVSAEVISGRNTKKEREDIIMRYKQGNIDMLCNADILIEGFDDDKVSVCLNLRPTMSAVIAEQRGGRVLRLNAADTDKVGYVVDFLDDDSLADNMTRPMPILYREVLGATAVPRAKASESKGAKEKSEPKEKTEEEPIPDLQVIGTEDQFMEILQKKEEYNFKKHRKQYEQKWQDEFAERLPHMEQQLKAARSRILGVKLAVTEALNMPAIRTGFIYPVLDGARMQQLIASAIDALRKVEILVLKTKNNLTLGQKYPGFDPLYRKKPYTLGSPSAIQACEIEIENMNQAIQARVDEIMSLIQTHETRLLRIKRSKELANWKTAADLKSLVRKYKLDYADVFIIVNSLRDENPEWVEMRVEPQGKENRVYSPDFIEELENQIITKFKRKKVA